MTNSVILSGAKDPSGFGYRTASTSSVSSPPGVISCTSSPTRALISARAIGETQLMSPCRLSASSTPVIVTVFFSPRALA